MGLAGPSDVYIHLKEGDWNKDPIKYTDINVSQAFVAAKEQFNMYAAETAGSVPFDTQKMEEELLKLMDNRDNLTYKPGIDFVNSIDDMMSKSNGLHMRQLGGLGMSFNSIAFGYGDEAKRPELEKKLKDLLIQGKEVPSLIATLEEIGDELTFFGQNLYKRKEDGKIKVFPKVYLTDPAEDEELLNAYQELRDTISTLKNIKTKGVEKVDLTAEVKNLASLLVKQGFKFHSTLFGVLDETKNTALQGGQVVARKNLNQLAKTMGLDYIDAEVNQTGAKTYDSSGVETIRAKGDVEIKIKWDLHDDHGSWSYLTSAKAHKFTAQSRESARYNKEGTKEIWKGRLVSGARYAVIFNEAGSDIETLFCNMYVHERTKLESSDSQILGYIGARCAANIMAGLPGEYMAHALKTGDGKPVPLHELFNMMSQQTNLNTISKYINLWFNDTAKNTVLDENKMKNGRTATERSAKVYKAIKDGVKFSATIGSVADLGGII